MMPYWLHGLLWLLFWCAIGVAIRPLIHGSGGRK